MPKAVSLHKRVIAITGKGGVGKTALTAMMTRILTESRSDLKVLLIDGDPAMGLSAALGVKVRRTIGEAREAIINAARTSGKQGKVQIAGMLDFLILDALAEMDEFSLLVMGRTETLGCFCPVNDLLRAAIETLSKSFDVVLIDCEAGLEQINRKVVRSVDELIIVTDATLRGIQTAALINKTTHDHNILPYGEIGLVLNRVRGEEAPIIQAAEKVGLKILGSIPEDENINRYDLVGKPITDLPSDSPGLIATREVLEAVLND
jgi:CO dehydrogenase maturation factor